MKRYMSVWLPFLLTDRAIQVRPELKQEAFVLAAAQRGRMVVEAANEIAAKKGIQQGFVVADARAILPGLKVFNYKEGIIEQLLTDLAEWALRFTPSCGIDLSDGIILDISGCSHLWGGEDRYLADIINKLGQKGFTAKAAIADTIATAWALARYSKEVTIAPPGDLLNTLSALPPAGLRLEAPTLERLQKLGFYRISSFINMPRTILRRRFGRELVERIEQALGAKPEMLKPVLPTVMFQKRLPCIEAIRTRTGIDIALQTLLKQLCEQLLKEKKGLRTGILKCYRLDGDIQKVQIGTHRPARNTLHLMKLFEQKIDTLKPGLGFELFLLEATVVDDLSVQQESLWSALGGGDENTELMHLLDRISGKVGSASIKRYLPVEQYWPERSIKISSAINEKPEISWNVDRLRPICLLDKPEIIDVTVPIPDYPPMLFIYKGHVHKIKKADGPERIARQWWQDPAKQIRDYYRVEDEHGARYWIFRSGTYEEGNPDWFLHGFFA